MSEHIWRNGPKRADDFIVPPRSERRPTMLPEAPAYDPVVDVGALRKKAERVEALEAEVASLRARVAELEAHLVEIDNARPTERDAR